MLQKHYPQILVAILCGVCTMLILSVGYYVPLAAGFTLDGREIFLTLGAALAGPWAAIIINIFMAIGIEIGYPQITIMGTTVDTIGHLFSTVLLAILYKKVIFERVKKPFRILGWVVMVPFYYWVLLTPIASILYFLAGISPSPLFLITLPIWPEVIVTTIVTTLILAALPERWRKPLWGPSSKAKAPRSMVGAS